MTVLTECCLEMHFYITIKMQSLHVACKMITTKKNFDWSRSRDPVPGYINSKEDFNILALLQVIENLGTLWRFVVGFMDISLSVFEL